MATLGSVISPFLKYCQVVIIQAKTPLTHRRSLDGLLTQLRFSQARELSTLTGSSVLLLVVSGGFVREDLVDMPLTYMRRTESGVVYTYSTEKCTLNSGDTRTHSRSCG